MGAPLSADDAGQIEKSSWVAFGAGKGAHTLYLLADANCPYCKDLWRILVPRLSSGSVEVRLIPVGKVAPTSMGKAVAVALSADPQKAWDMAMTSDLPPMNLIPLGGEADIDPTVKRISEEQNLTLTQKGALHSLLAAEAQILVNHELMNRLKIVSTPILFWRDTSGTMRRFDGEPSLNDLGLIISASQPAT